MALTTQCEALYRRYIAGWLVGRKMMAANTLVIVLKVLPANRSRFCLLVESFCSHQAIKMVWLVGCSSVTSSLRD